ncbi:MAG: hypothetical protein ABIT16_01755 [Croceibacterium sp.]
MADAPVAFAAYAGQTGAVGGSRNPIRWWTGLDRPLRALPRWAAALALALVAASFAWSAIAVGGFETPDGRSRAIVVTEDGFGDIALYEHINRRMAAGEGYYQAALAEHRRHGYPAEPFVTVRTPVMAWGAKVWGAGGWRVVALVLLLANVVAWTGALSHRTVSAERVGVALLIFVGGLAVFNDRYGVVHDLLAGLFVSLALGLYRPGRWWPSWLAAAAGLAIRELALPFVLLWAALALAERRWREFAAIVALLALFVLGMALHAGAVAAARLPGDGVSGGWAEMLGPMMFLSSLLQLTPLLVLPPTVAAPFALLPLLGWAGLGGRTGLFASLWFVGFALFVALFARAGNFYWVLLVLPAYAGGLALAPRALRDLLAALRGLG